MSKLNKSKPSPGDVYDIRDYISEKNKNILHKFSQDILKESEKIVNENNIVLLPFIGVLIVIDRYVDYFKDIFLKECIEDGKYEQSNINILQSLKKGIEGITTLKSIIAMFLLDEIEGKEEHEN